VTSFKETTLTRIRSRWGTAVPQPGLEAYVTSWWHLLVSVPSVGLFNLLVVSLATWSNVSLGVPYLVGLGVTVILTVVAMSSWFVLYHGVKQATGRALGLSARDSRRPRRGQP